MRGGAGGHLGEIGEFVRGYRFVEAAGPGPLDGHVVERHRGYLPIPLLRPLGTEAGRAAHRAPGRGHERQRATYVTAVTLRDPRTGSIR
ncbi:hypothetical protein GCM10009681_46080 [Luedemannella helvata]|uniref:Uncharacterized protein n=1 Tax=Luedemannella helvata TaxID=349315 RepID=A0ABP4X7C1_9ACTN